jgi:cell division initiation protein
MERIMPIDLERVNLKRSLRGYDRSQVQDLMNRAAKEMASLRSDLDEAKSENLRMKQELESLRAQENSLKEILVLAQRTADDTRVAAHKEADLVMEDARQKALEAESQMQSKINDLRWELERLRLDKQKFLNSYRAALEAQLRDLVEINGFTVIEGEAAANAVEA